MDKQMLRKNYLDDYSRIEEGIRQFESAHGSLLGLQTEGAMDSFINQIIDSELRVSYISKLLKRELSQTVTDPNDDAFHPLKAAILHSRAGDFDEACWLVFLFVHFGKHRKRGWGYLRHTYGALETQPGWTWSWTASDPYSFRIWLEANRAQIAERGGGFGNHRKYLSLQAFTSSGTGAAVQTYVEWVLESGGDHRERFDTFSGSPTERFAAMYKSMSAIASFGRVAKFDYLTMLMKLQFTDVVPPHSYIVGATGPQDGASLLFFNYKKAATAKVLQPRLLDLGEKLALAPDVLEDAVCNWQKSPTSYLKFSG